MFDHLYGHKARLSKSAVFSFRRYGDWMMILGSVISAVLAGMSGGYMFSLKSLPDPHLVLMCVQVWTIQTVKVWIVPTT